MKRINFFSPYRFAALLAIGLTWSLLSSCKKEEAVTPDTSQEASFRLVIDVNEVYPGEPEYFNFPMVRVALNGRRLDGAISSLFYEEKGERSDDFVITYEGQAPLSGRRITIRSTEPIGGFGVGISTGYVGLTYQVYRNDELLDTDVTSPADDNQTYMLTYSASVGVVAKTFIP